MECRTVKLFAAIAAAALSAAAFASSAPRFSKAVPVWPEGRELVKNDFVEFKTSFDAKPGAKAFLRITGSSCYRIWLNGEHAGYGPARAAKGFFRVDEWPLAARPGVNTVSIEVSAYNCDNFYIPNQSAFLQAEAVVDGRVAAATGPAGDFAAFSTPRIVECSRFSFQRAFGEAYRLGRSFAQAGYKLAERPAARLIERIAPYPRLDVNGNLEKIGDTAVAVRKPARYRGSRFDSSGYPPKRQKINIFRMLQEHVCAKTAQRPRGGELAAGEGELFDCGLEETGFPAADVECLEAGRLVFAFDEHLDRNGMVDPLRGTVANAVVWDVEPGRLRLEAFEPYAFRYLHVYAVSGRFKVSGASVRRYRSPAADKASLETSDPQIDAVFAAARETFAQNAVDVFTDCPGRERAGWLCDSFFTGAASAILTGDTALERLFIQNYILPDGFDGIPDGMLPMCYPADSMGDYIPNWAMWFVIQTEQYLARSGDRASVDALKPRLVKLVAFLKRYRNSDGLLEKLPKWVFVEWSEANRLVQDVNYPSNMTWAEVLDCMDRLYGMPELAEEAAKVRETVRRQSWTGKWFCDNATRQKDGTLKLSGKCTETCQYYAFFFKTAAPETHPELWKTLVEDFGPLRDTRKTHPAVYPSNAFIGNFLRFELLSRAGLDARLLKETKEYFGAMARKTGTLWENSHDNASCNHGFAGYAAVLYLRGVAGVVSVDAASRTVRVRAPSVREKKCIAKLPVPGGMLEYGWSGLDAQGGPAGEVFKAPAGWRLVKSGR